MVKAKSTKKAGSLLRRPTSYDVAKAAGVAQSTVSRCFQANSSISPDTRARIFRIAAELGYSTNALARSLITQRSSMIGVIATQFTIRNNPDLVFEIGRTLQEAGYQMLLMVIEQDATISGTIQSALEYPLDGLICCAIMSEADMDHFRKRTVPVVFFNREVNFEGADSIATDHTQAGREIADALFAAGHRRMACMQGPEEAPVSRLRVDAFVSRCAELGLDDIRRCSTDYSYESGRTKFLEFAKGHGLPEAIFCTNDQLALGVMDACRFELGLSIPEDISIVGFDDVAEAGRPTYELTTIHQPVVDMALRAIALLRERIEHPELKTRSIRVPGRFMVRKSARIVVSPQPD